MNKQDGGPAFPVQANHQYEGMSLRDHFAAAALTGWLSGPCQGDVLDDYEDDDPAFAEHQRKVAAACYGYADAMLEERTKE